VLHLLDGTRTVDEARAAVAARGRTPPPTTLLECVLKTLDLAGLVDTPASRAARARIDAAFLSLPERPPVHAGSVYPASQGDILRGLAGEQVGGEPLPQRALVPHIDWSRGRAAYARAYTALRGSVDRYERVILLGTAHAGLEEPAAVYTKPYRTPSGILPNDLEAIAALTDALPWLRKEEAAHRWEHSIEINAALLRAVWPEDRPLRAIPMLVASPTGALASSPQRAFALAAALRDLLAADPGRTLVLAAGDLAHLGRLYGDPPVEGHCPGGLEDLDRSLVLAALAGNTDAILRHAQAPAARRVCGLGPLWLMAATHPSSSASVVHWQVWMGHGSLVSFAFGA
jgi:AmmeMemoRadiSam system protein B